MFDIIIYFNFNVNKYCNIDNFSLIFYPLIKNVFQRINNEVDNVNNVDK